MCTASSYCRTPSQRLQARESYAALASGSLRPDPRILRSERLQWLSSQGFCRCANPSASTRRELHRFCPLPGSSRRIPWLCKSGPVAQTAASLGRREPVLLVRNALRPCFRHPSASRGPTRFLSERRGMPALAGKTDQGIADALHQTAGISPPCLASCHTPTPTYLPCTYRPEARTGTSPPPSFRPSAESSTPMR
jgi:hypothetical protein